MADTDNLEKTNVLGRANSMDEETVPDAMESTYRAPQSMEDVSDSGDRTVKGLPMPDAAEPTNDEPIEHTLRPEGPAPQWNAPVDNEPTTLKFDLKGIEYDEIKCLSDNSGEAQVYLVERDGKEFVLKVYYPNFNINRKLLQVVRSLNFELVVTVYDYGKTYVDGKSRYYELMEYLRGGTLKDVNVNGDINRFRRLALQAAGALAYCHQNHVLHKDVKPTNFFFRDVEQKQLVLGDFGISALQEGEGKSFHTTQARTPIYAAPEMYSDVIDGVVDISYAADFYSLGITLFALWLGENPMSSNERTMMRQKNEGRLPRLTELPEQVKRIVQGLTSVNQQSRWGYDEVERWFRGEDVKVDISSPFLNYKSFIVDPERNLVADNVHELVPMLIANERLGMNYLYNGRITQWLEASGNTKLSTIVKDLITNNYPADQKAGLMAACYAMEPTLPYHDVQGMECDDEHALALSLLSYPEQYAILLQNPHDTLFLWLERHTKCDVERMRTYFRGQNDGRIGVMRMVFEIDKDMPFLAKHPSSTVEEIVYAYGHHQLTDDEWNALCDGRLLSWMYSHEDLMACEALRIMTYGQTPSRTLGYKILYNINREAAYDLCNAKTPKEIGEILSHELMQAEHLSEADMAERMRDYYDMDGRFCYYAQLHGWSDLLAEARRCFDLNLEENRERLGAYDLRTALYRYAAILGHRPTYLMPDGSILTDGRNLNSLNASAYRSEMRSGSFVQWLSVFYHEDPSRDFSEEYSYERELEEWVMALGRLDQQQNYYRRYMKACEETKERVAEVKRQWNHAQRTERFWKCLFFVVCLIWAGMVLTMGVPDRSYLFDHYFLTIILPLGGMTGLIIAVRAYFKGYGAAISALFGAAGLASAYLPYMALNYIDQSYPRYFHYVVVAITAVYACVAWLTDLSRNQAADPKFVDSVLKKQDIRSSLIDPLYYTFKTRSHRYKASNFGLLDEVEDQTRSLSGESVIHYALWTLAVLVMILELCVFSPKVFGWHQTTNDTQTTQQQVE